MNRRVTATRLISGALSYCVCIVTFAQTPTADAPAVGGSTVAVAPPESGQSPRFGGGSSGQAWVIKPRITLSETITDNASLNQSRQGKQTEFITEVSPGVRVEARTERLQAYLDYAVVGQLYANESSNNRTLNSLNSFGTLEAVDKWLFVDFSGVITQQSVSAFGAQSPSNTAINSNSSETSSYRFSPYIRGQIAGQVEYFLRYAYSTTSSGSGGISDINVSQWNGQLRGSTPFQVLNWSVDANQLTSDYSNGRTNESKQVRGIGTYSIDPQFRVSLSAGRESNNYLSQEQESHTTHGFGFDWNPTERTTFSAFKEHRFFGDGHNVSFNHRFPMSAFQFSDKRDVSVLPTQSALVGLGSVYDLYYLALTNRYPNPTDRANATNAILASQGLSPNQQVVSSFLSSQASVLRSQQVSYVLFGARNSITLLVNRNESRSLQTSQFLGDDLSQNSVIRQRGVSISYSHQLGALTNLNLLASLQESTGYGGTDRKANSSIYQVNVSTRLGARTTGALSARHSSFDNYSTPYSENALVGTVSFVY